MVLQVIAALGGVMGVWIVLWYSHRYLAWRHADRLLRRAEVRWTARRELAPRELEELRGAVEEALSWGDERSARIVGTVKGRGVAGSLAVLAAQDGASEEGQKLLDRLWALMVARRDRAPLSARGLRDGGQGAPMSAGGSP